MRRDLLRRLDRLAPDRSLPNVVLVMQAEGESSEAMRERHCSERHGGGPCDCGAVVWVMMPSREAVARCQARWPEQ